MNPIDKMEPLPHTPMARRAMTAEECGRLLAVSPEPFHSVFKFIMNTGLRHSQVVEMLWREVDLEQGILTIPPDRVGNKNGELWKLNLNDVAVEAIRTRLPKHCPPEPAGRVWKNARGQRWQASLLRGFREYVKDAGIDPVGLDIHALRHTWGSLLGANGTDRATLKALMQLKSDAIVNVYVHAYEDNIKKAAQASSVGVGTKPPQDSKKR